MFIPTIMFADMECDGCSGCTTKEEYIEAFNMIDDCINELVKIKFWQFNKKRKENKKLTMLIQRPKTNE